MDHRIDHPTEPAEPTPAPATAGEAPPEPEAANPPAAIESEPEVVLEAADAALGPEPEVVAEAPATAVAVEPEPVVAPESGPEALAVEPEPVVAPESGPEALAVEPEPMVAPESGPEALAVESGPAPEPGRGPVVPEHELERAPVATTTTAGVAAAPIDTAPDPAALVPLEQLAPAIHAASVSRRAFLGFGLAITGALVGAAGIAKLFPVFADDSPAVSPISPAYDPASRQWTFIVDTATCIGCGMCVVACKEENHVPEEGEYTRTWVERHVTTSDGTVYVDSPDAGMNGFPPQSTAPGAAGKPVDSSFFEPRLCMQCEDSPCTSVCPVGATYRTPDGVILVDARRCIGCGYCVVACPYGARYLVPDGPDTPGGYAGVADKCTWCYHRITNGRKPACVDICPVKARMFGEASDPDIAAILASGKAKPLHPEYGTKPRVLYLGPAVKEA